MVWGILFIIVGLYLIIMTELGKGQPERFREGFMQDNGYSGSLVALWYFIGRPREARDAIVNNKNIRTKYIIECYIRSIILIVVGVYLVFWS